MCATQQRTHALARQMIETQVPRAGGWVSGGGRNALVHHRHSCAILSSAVPVRACARWCARDAQQHTRHRAVQTQTPDAGPRARSRALPLRTPATLSSNLLRAVSAPAGVGGWRQKQYRWLRQDARAVEVGTDELDGPLAPKAEGVRTTHPNLHPRRWQAGGCN